MTRPDPMKPLPRIWWAIQWMALLCIPMLLFWWAIGALTPWKILTSLLIPFALLMTFSLIKDRLDEQS